MDPDLIDRLRSDLQAADFRTASITQLIGIEADGARQRGVFAPARRALASLGDDAHTHAVGPLAALIQLFLLGETLPKRCIETAFPATGVQGALALGLLAVPQEPEAAMGAGADSADRADHAGRAAAAEPRYRAAISLNPVSVADPLDDEPREWWILSDLDDQLRNEAAAPQHVMGVGGATRSLIAQLPIGRVERALDLGTGCGIVALHLAQRGPVIATDLSARALDFARANALLNEVSGIEFREGDLFSPVAGEIFELIASNPPFVVTPRADASAERYLYRDAGLVGDSLAERVVTEAPAFLAEGGTLVCLANWESPWGIDALDRVREWVEAGEGTLAAWVIERDRVAPVQYAETWARDGGARPGDPEFERLVSAWLDDFAARRIVALGLGSIRIRRLDVPQGHMSAEASPLGSPGFVHAERAGGAFGPRPGAALDAAFDAMIVAEGLDDAQMLERRWVLDAAVREEREHRPGESDPRAIALVTDRGIARRVTADTLLAAAVGACDGELTLGQISDALATILEVDAAAADEALVGGIRELVRLGMIAPAATGEDQPAR